MPAIFSFISNNVRPENDVLQVWSAFEELGQCMKADPESIHSAGAVIVLELAVLACPALMKPCNMTVPLQAMFLLPDGILGHCCSQSADASHPLQNQLWLVPLLQGSLGWVAHARLDCS